MRIRAIVTMVGLSAAPAWASDFDQVRSLSQDQLNAVTRDLGAAFAYKGVAPGTTLGVIGFDLGVEITDTKLENIGAIRAAGNDAPDHLVIPKFHAHKGLWGGFDIGAFVGGASRVSATLYGLDLRYAVIEDGLAAPAVSLRASGTRAIGLGPLKVDTAALDAMVSKRLALFTPYAGAGIVRMRGSVDGSGLASETASKGRVFAGINLNLLATNLAFEAEKLGDNTSLSAKVGFRF